MLVLTVAMVMNFLRVFALLPLLGFLFQPNYQVGDISILTPGRGEVVRGVVQVTGSTGTSGFASYNLAYAYENSYTTNWFPIASASQPVNSGLLGSWDTTTITDGNYSLRLVVLHQDGSQNEALTKNVQVRNYTSPETTAGTGATSAVNPGQPQQPVADGNSTSGTNPASLEQIELRQAVINGVALGGGIIILFGIYALIRRESRR